MQFIRDAAFVYRFVGGEHLLLALKRGRRAPMFMLTATGAYVWELLATWRSQDELARGIVERFVVAEDTARLDVMAFLDQLRSMDAITVREAA